jgi:nucleoside phosphorylase
MLVIFAAFKKEAADLLKAVKLKKIIKTKSTVIYDGTIKNKRIIICITGMGKSNSLFAVSQIIKMNLENPVFLILGISGALTDNLDIGDLVVYGSIKNLEKFKIEENEQENKDGSPDAQKHNLDDDGRAKHQAIMQCNGNILSLSYGERPADVKTTDNHLSGLDETKSSYKVLNGDFNLLKKKWESSIKKLRILKASGGLVSYVVTDRKEKDALHKIHGIEAIDMESYYIADAAINNRVPVLCIRSISDNLIEPIPELIVRFNSGNFIYKFNCLAGLIFSKTQSRSMIISGKNIAKACRNLNYFIKNIILPYFGYE